MKKTRFRASVSGSDPPRPYAPSCRCRAAIVPATNGVELAVVLALLLVELALLLRRGILVLLVLRNKIVHVAPCLCELHLVHALACVPMQESLAPEHRREVFGHALEHLLDGRRVSGERSRHGIAASRAMSAERSLS